MEAVFAEERAYSVHHVCLPAVVYFYTKNIYVFFTLIYLFESIEYLISLANDEWGEDPADSLIGDILMALVGLGAAMQFEMEKKSKLQFAIHAIILGLASAFTVLIIWEDITGAFVYYAIIHSIVAPLISKEWLLFTIVNFIIIAAIATRGFQREFSHTPIAALISFTSTTLLLKIAQWTNLKDRWQR